MISVCWLKYLGSVCRNFFISFLPIVSLSVIHLMYNGNIPFILEKLWVQKKYLSYLQDMVVCIFGSIFLEYLNMLFLTNCSLK